jgi:anaerobic magnesium-protoporphyrin IX monomethyl ester cyclase
MARVLLIMPRLPQRMGAPYLGQLYIAASLMADGHEVRCLDLGAPHIPFGDDGAVAFAEAFAPDLIGMTLFTYGVARGYALAAQLRPHCRMLAAGGPHPTVLPDEPLGHGFDVAIAGEGEQAIVQLARVLDGQGELAQVSNAVFEGGRGPVAAAIADLDVLPYPHTAYSAYDHSHFSPDGVVVPGGLMTSRGCPARCTFCANYVTGRAFRFRSAGNVIAEMLTLRRTYQICTFPIWDDAFTANRPRLNTLCDAILAEPELDGITWTCITPGNMVKPKDLRRMRAAGCVAINFGIESGDRRTLKMIKKGQRPEHIIDAVKAAKEEGMQTVVNFMFGFPGEGVVNLDHTLDLMETLSAHTDYFNSRGVLVPFPGTAIYDTHREAYGLDGWWRDQAMVPIEPDLGDAFASLVAQEVDPTLALDFFRYSPEVRDKIAECVRFKAQHNQRTVRKFMQPVAPAA